MLGGTFQVFVGVDILLFRSCIAFHRHYSSRCFDDRSAGTAPDPLVWSAGALPKRRGIV